MQSERAVLDLVGLIYDAAGDASKWPVFLDRLGSDVQSPIANFYSWDTEHFQSSVAAIIGIDEDGVRQHTEYYNERNIFMLRGAHLLTPGAVRNADELCPKDELLRSEYYHDYMVPRRLRYGLNAVLFKDKSITASLGLIRYSNAKPYGEEEAELLRILLPHLQRAVQLHQRITGLEVQAKVASTALDHWSLGVILLNAEGQVLLMNRSAESILNQKDGLTFDCKGLRAATSQATTAFRGLIHSATKTTISQVKPSGVKSASNGLPNPGGPLSLPRPSGKRPLQVLVSPACANSLLFPTPQAAVAVFITDPEDTPRTDEAVLRQLYNLSRAEARTVTILVQGRSLSNISDELHVSMNTIKTHLKRVFEKTGAKRQADLVRVILTGLASSGPQNGGEV